MKYSVLIIEDEPWQAQALARQLTQYDVIMSGNGYEAIQSIDVRVPDVIVLDLLLSGSTALTLIHELKSHADLTSIPIIIVSTLAEALPSKSLHRYGVVAIIDKTTMRHGDVRRAVEAASA